MKSTGMGEAPGSWRVEFIWDLARWTLSLRENSEDFRGGGTSGVRVADFRKTDFAMRIDDEGGRVRRFAGSLPAEGVEIGELIGGVEQEMEVRREFLVRDELGGTIARTRVDHDDAGTGIGKGGGAGYKLLYLPVAERTLVTGESTENDEDYRPLPGIFRQAELRAIERL
jgi:hypothetical protein